MCLCLIGAALGFLLGAPLALSFGLPPYTFGLLGGGVGFFGDFKILRRLRSKEKQAIRKISGEDNV